MVAGGIIVLLIAVVADYYAYPVFSRAGGRSFNTDENALWLRYTWYFGLRSDEDRRDLARRLADRRIRYAYFHVRSIQKDGALKYHFRGHARELTSTLRRLAPSVENLAWIYAGNRRGAGEVDLSDSEVRRNAVAQAVWLVKECGFDGVQWDYEIW